MIDAARVRKDLRAMADGEPSAQSSIGYTGSPRVHLGIGAPGLHDYADEIVADHKGELTLDRVISLLDSLYDGDTIEEPILAGLLLARLPAVRKELPLDVLGRWLGRLTGWVEVDSTCASTFTAKDIYGRWDEWSVFLRALNKDTNINKRRASLVLPIRTLRESDDTRAMALVSELVDGLASERDKRIVKAVSWVLREAAKRHKDAVAAYIETHGSDLHASVVREVRAKLTIGKKR